MSGPSLGPAADGALVDESRLIRADLSPGKRLAALALKWESLLFLIFVAMMAANSLLSPVFLDPANLLDATFNFTEKAIIAL
ncbi:MAG TPA: ABC transporter permease, partial [Spirochaetia bacterium]|nr:ABC transporter permease [Spirochaetia bacterium]